MGADNDCLVGNGGVGVGRTCASLGHGFGGAQSVHVLLGTNGQITSNCLEVSGGWSCDEVDVDGPVDVHLLVDTKITALGQTEIDGAFMSIDASGDGAQISWKNRGRRPRTR